MMASFDESLGSVGLEKHCASHLAEPRGNQRNPKPNVSPRSNTMMLKQISKEDVISKV